LIGFAGMYIPYFYAEDYAITYKITSGAITFYMLTFINAGSVFGRTLPNFVADFVGPFNVIGPACLISGLLGLCFIAAKSQASLIALCVLYGFSSGALPSLSPAVLVSISMHRRGMIGTRLGMGFFSASIGILLGNPIAGVILNHSGYTAMWVFSGVLFASSGALMVIARLSKTGLKLRVKA